MQPDPDMPRLLNVIEITEPCQVPWESMTGDEQIRFCGMCKKNVYNISEMSSSEAESFLQMNLGSVCLGYIRRADGTIVTDSCPKILKPVRDGIRRLARIVAIVLGAVMSASAGLAQGESASQYTKEQNAALAAGRFRETRPAARFGGAPNIWRSETPHYPSFSLSELTSGEFALKPESEVFLKDGKLFISEEVPQDNQKQPISSNRRAGACIDGCTALGAFRRGKEWVAKNNDRIAESYFKLSLTLSKRPHFETTAETQEILQEYARLLRRTGRAPLAEQTLKNEMTGDRKMMWNRAYSLLGLDPATLARKPQRKIPKGHK